MLAAAWSLALHTAQLLYVAVSLAAPQDLPVIDGARQGTTAATTPAAGSVGSGGTSGTDSRRGDGPHLRRRVGASQVGVRDGPDASRIHSSRRQRPYAGVGLL